jgi:hypothetical protein
LEKETRNFPGLGKSQRSGFQGLESEENVMKMLPFSTEQAARGYLMQQLAFRGYLVQLTDSRFPRADMLVVSPENKYFGIDVKGQQTRNFWQYKCPKVSIDLYYAFVFVSASEPSFACVMSSEEAAKRWHAYHDASIAKGNKEDNRWGVNWKTPLDRKDKWEILPA